MFKSVLLLVVTATLFPGLCEAQIFPHITRTRRVCCLKNYGYTTSQLSNPVTAISFDALATLDSNIQNSNPLPYRQGDIKSFPLRVTRLRNDHCEISNVSFIARRDGTWTMSFQARQDPQLVEQRRRPIFVRYIQNRFVVKVRLVTNDRIPTNPETEAVAAPVVGSIDASDFWISRGQVQNRFANGASASLKNHFEQLQRIQVDLQYE